MMTPPHTHSFIPFSTLLMLLLDFQWTNNVLDYSWIKCRATTLDDGGRNGNVEGHWREGKKLLIWTAYPSSSCKQDGSRENNGSSFGGERKAKVVSCFSSMKSLLIKVPLHHFSFLPFDDNAHELQQLSRLSAAVFLCWRCTLHDG